jgi:hypothetical protein
MRTWAWQEMDNHFGTDHAPRWAISVHEPARALRPELCVWRKRMTLDEARALLARTIEVLVVHPARAAHFQHFQRGGTHEERMSALREDRITKFFTALAPLGVARPLPGTTLSVATD